MSAVPPEATEFQTKFRKNLIYFHLLGLNVGLVIKFLFDGLDTLDMTAQLVLVLVNSLQTLFQLADLLIPGVYSRLKFFRADAGLLQGGG